MVKTDAVIVQSDVGAIAVPASKIGDHIHKYVSDFLKEEEHSVNGVALTLDLNDGANLVFAHRTKTNWEIDAYVGTKWDGDLKAGAKIIKRW